MSPLPATLCALALACPHLIAQVIAEVEPNGQRSQAMSVLSGQQIEGSIATVADADWFRFVLPAPSDLLAWTGPGLVGQIGDTVLRLYDASGNVLADVNDGSLLTSGFYSELKTANLPAGTYYLQVVGYQGATGTYSLDLITAPLNTYGNTPVLAPIAEAQEPNDPRIGGRATATAWFTANFGIIANGGGGIAWSAGYSGNSDYDLYAFVVPQPATITLSTGPVPGTSGPPGVGDTVVHLFDANMIRLAFDDDGGKGDYSLLVYTITTPGTYYVAVNGFGSAHVGSYELDILGPLPPLPAGRSSLIEHAATCSGAAGPVRLGTRDNAFGFPGHPELPVLGSTFCCDVTNAPASALVVTVFDLQLAQQPIVGTPFSPGCIYELPLTAPFAELRLTDSLGNSCWPLRLPLQVDAMGIVLQMQAIAADLAAPQPEILVSNRCVAVCGIVHD
jgi:Bacterial pre-peptidase C-terminal domain